MSGSLVRGLSTKLHRLVDVIGELRSPGPPVNDAKAQMAQMNSPVNVRAMRKMTVSALGGNNDLSMTHYAPPARYG